MTNPPPSDSPGSLTDLDQRIKRVVDEMEEAEQKKHVPAYVNDLISNIRFKLVGYDLEGNPCDWREDLDAVMGIERLLVVDPNQVKKEFDRIRQEAETETEREQMSMNTILSSEGWHAYPLLKKTLERVRREGRIILAGLEDDYGQFCPIASNYGLDRMPRSAHLGDHEFSCWDINTLAIPSTNRYMYINPDKTAINCRTSVLPEIPTSGLHHALPSLPEEMYSIKTRRLGLGTALKFLQASLAEREGQEDMSFNIGTIYPWDVTGLADSGMSKIRNVVSYVHNSRIWDMDPLGGYRTEMSPIVQERPKGIREFVGTIAWFARHNNIGHALKKMRFPESVLSTRKWDFSALDRVVDQMQQQLWDERHHGDHV